MIHILTAAEMTFQVSVLILAIGLVRRMFSDRLNAGFQYFLWIFVALRLLFPVGMMVEMSLPENIWNLAEAVLEHENESMDDSTQKGLAEAVRGSLMDTPEMGTDTDDTGISAGSLYLIIATDNFAGILFVVRSIGCVTLGLYIFICNLRFFAHLRKYRHMLRTLPYDLPLYAMPGCNCLTGVLAPAIYVDTEAFTGEAEVDYVIQHELQHYHVRDNLWQLVRTLCLILQWYNPLVWWAYFASRRDCELACDVRTTRKMTAEEKYVYGQTLLSACRAGASKKITMTTAMGEGKKFMEERLKNLMQTKKKRAAVLSAVIVALVALISTVTVSLSTDNFDRTEVVYAENGAIRFSDMDVAAAQTIVHQYISEEIYDTTDNRTYQIYYSNLEYPEEKQTSAYLNSCYQKGYTEGNVIMLRLDRVSILQESYDGTEWPEVVRNPDWCIWLGRENADAEWEIISQGY